MNTPSDNDRGQWGSRLGFILAAAGSAVGLGNIWRFPYVTGENGGAAFVFVYLLCVFLIGLPLLYVELSLGRASQRNPVDAFKATRPGSPFFLTGFICLAACFVVLTYYGVIAGWTVGYFIAQITQTQLDFAEYTANPVAVLPVFALFIVATIYIVSAGVEKGIEKYSVIRAVGAVNRSDITLLVTDASELATAQDAHIAGLAWEICRGLIVVINKWDLFADEGAGARYHAAAMIRDRLHFMPYVPIVFTSALEGEGIKTLMDTAQDLWLERMRLVRSRDLQFMLADALADHQPPVVRKHRGQRVQINRIQQVGINPPTFLFTVNNPQLVHYTYQRYLENKIRDTFGFDRTHLKLVFKAR